jgi:hypothetical protein
MADASHQETSIPEINTGFSRSLSKLSDLVRRVMALDTVCQRQANIEKLLDRFLKAVFDEKKAPTAAAMRCL